MPLIRECNKLKNKVGSEIIGRGTALILSLLALSAFSFYLDNDNLAAAYPFIFFDPFEKSPSSPLPAGQPRSASPSPGGSGRTAPA